MTLSFNYYQDPGHGWVEVDKQMLVDLGINELISDCSYVNDNKVYLEEDCDADLFLKELVANEKEFKLIDVYQEVTPIRNYDRYRGGS